MQGRRQFSARRTGWLDGAPRRGPLVPRDFVHPDGLTELRAEPVLPSPSRLGRAGLPPCSLVASRHRAAMGRAAGIVALQRCGIYDGMWRRLLQLLRRQDARAPGRQDTWPLSIGKAGAGAEQGRPFCREGTRPAAALSIGTCWYRQVETTA